MPVTAVVELQAVRILLFSGSWENHSASYRVMGGGGMEAHACHGVDLGDYRFISRVH